MSAWHRQLALGMYVLWLVAVVLVVAGRQTAFPTLPGTVTGVALGAVVFVILGAARVLRAAADRFLG
jgi:hypothetical protein